MPSKTIDKSLIERPEYDDESEELEVNCYDTSMFIMQMDKDSNGNPVEAWIQLHKGQAKQLVEIINKWVKSK